MLNYVPQVGNGGASVGVHHIVRVSLSGKCENGNTEQQYSAAWCRNDPTEQLCKTEEKSG